MACKVHNSDFMFVIQATPKHQKHCFISYYQIYEMTKPINH